MVLIGIDPSIKELGVAVNVDGTIVAAELIRGVTVKSLDVRCAQIKKKIWKHFSAYNPEVIIELPETYGGRAAKGDGNNLITLAFLVGYLSASLPGNVELVKPRDWKGTVPGDIFADRVYAKLDEREKALVDVTAKGARHNVLDAIGLTFYRNPRK